MLAYYVLCGSSGKRVFSKFEKFLTSPGKKKKKKGETELSKQHTKVERNTQI